MTEPSLHQQTECAPDLKAGIYQHYKGPCYQVLGYGHDSNIEGRLIVIYIGLELDERKPGPRWAVRNATEGHDAFFDLMHQIDGTWEVCTSDKHHIDVCRLHDHKQRFTYLGPSYA